MKLSIRLLVLTFLSICLLTVTACHALAATYYVDSVSGSDSNNGTSTLTPWQTISKINGSTFLSGDSILLKRGDTWREQLTVPASNLTFADYGSGALPLVKGSDVFSTWTAVPAPAFTDNFETGNISKWDTMETSSGTVSASTTQAFEGTYSLKSAVSSSAGYAKVVKNNAIIAGSGGDMWFTARIFLPTGYNTTGFTKIANFTENGGAFNSFVLGITSGGKIGVVNPGAGYAEYDGTSTIPINQWVSVRMHVKVANAGHVDVWVDNSAEINVDADTFVTNPYAHLRVGVEAASGDTPTIYYDYIRVGQTVVDPSVPTGYYKTGLTTQPNDAFANGQRLIIEPYLLVSYAMPYHLYESAGRMGYDKPDNIVYIRSISDVDPNTQTIELSQRDNGILINNKSSDTLSNLSVQQGNDKIYGGVRIEGTGGSHILSNIDASYNANAGVEIDGGSQSNTINGGTFNNNIRFGIHIYQSNNNTVKNTTSGGTLEPTNGSLIGELSDNTLFDTNTVNATQGYAIDCLSSVSEIMRNNVVSGTQSGLWIEGNCPTYLIEKNSVSNVLSAAGITVSNTVAGSSPNGIIQQNTVDNSYTGIELDYHIADSGTIRYNVVKNTKSTTPYGDIKVFLADGVHIYNNTLVNGGGVGIGIYSNGPDIPDNTKVENNIVYKSTSYAFYIDGAGINNTFDYNDYYKSSGNLFSWLGTNYSSSQFSSYKSASTQDAHSIIFDPLFTNTSTDFRLQAGSSAIDSGTNVGLTSDYPGNTVPQGSGVDIGAYEYIPPATPTPTPIATPVPQASTSSGSSGGPTNPNTHSNWSYTVQAGQGYVGIPQFIHGDGDASNAMILISNDAHHDGVHVTIKKLNLWELINMAIKVAFPWMQGYNTVSDIYSYSAFAAFNGYPVTQFDKSVTVAIIYNPDQLFGHKPSQLRIATFDTKSGKWKQLTNKNVINVSTHTIANTTRVLGYFTVVYPR